MGVLYESNEHSENTKYSTMAIIIIVPHVYYMFIE